MLSKLSVILKLIGLSLSLSFQRLSLIVSAKLHQKTYKAVATPKNVVVVGGSFGGFFLAKQLSESLPTGYRVVLIEKHSHYHFTWNFPRITVVPGHDHKAFVPYPKQPRQAPDGVYLFQRGNVTAIDTTKVTLEDGSQIEFEYLVIATGSQKRYPAQLDADEKLDCMTFFEEQQNRIKGAQNIVIVGGGAAGVEIAGDIRTKYPDKKVTLVHSRDRLLNNFGVGLHERAKPALEALGVKLYLGERVVAGLEEEDPKQITLRSGNVLGCDLVIRCTGQSPQSTLIKDFSPSSIAPSGAVRVEPTLQLKNSPSPKIFAVGDVIDLPGPKLGRGASMQGIFCAENIIRAIKNKPLKTYTPSIIDRSIELTLGLGKNVMYINDGKNDISFGMKVPDEAMHAAQAWAIMDAQPFQDPTDVEANKLAASA